MALLKQNTAYNRMIFMVNASDHLSKMTSMGSLALNISKNGAAFALAAGSISEVGSGWYKAACGATDLSVLGDLAFHITEATAKTDDTDFVDQVIALDIANATFPANFPALKIDSSGRVDLGAWLGSSLASVPVAGIPQVDARRWLGSIPNALISGRVDASATLAAGVPTNFVSLKIDSSGRVDLGAWLGSSLASVPIAGIPQVDARRWLGSIPNALIGGRVDASATLAAGVPTNFSALSISATGGVNATVPSYVNASLSQAFPTNFSSLSISATGGVNATVPGYVNASIPTVVLATVTGAVTVGTNNDKTGYSLAAGQLFIKKNTALGNFMVLMIDSSDHVTPKTGLTVAGQVSIDGAAFADLAGAVSEVASGVYKVNLAQADTNGTSLMFKFTASGADARYIPVITQA